MKIIFKDYFQKIINGRGSNAYVRTRAIRPLSDRHAGITQASPKHHPNMTHNPTNKPDQVRKYLKRFVLVHYLRNEFRFLTNVDKMEMVWKCLISSNERTVSSKAFGFKAFSTSKLREFPLIGALTTPTKVGLAVYKGRPYPQRGKSRFYFVCVSRFTKQVYQLAGGASQAPGVFFRGRAERKSLRKAPSPARTLYSPDQPGGILAKLNDKVSHYIVRYELY